MLPFRGGVVPDRVSNCTFGLPLVRVAVSAIEKCELSFFGLQCTFASAAVRAKNGKNNEIQGWAARWSPPKTPCYLSSEH